MASKPLFNWLTERSSGLLLHPTSLPGNNGIGNFGKAAYRFVDFLADCGFGAWQMCPLGPTGFGDSPYQCFSAFAGNPYLVDLDALVDFKLLKEAELAPLRKLPATKVDYGALFNNFHAIIEKAAKRFLSNGGELPGYGSFANFKKANRNWLDAYAAFMACKAHYDGKCWLDWPVSVRSFAKLQKASLFEKLEDEMEVIRCIQFLFFAQWSRLKRYADEHGVQIIGDAPIFVALDSADVWEEPTLFQVDKKTFAPKVVAGVPPDYFSATGQLWGNPLYDWPAHKDQDYAWWISRLNTNFKFFDIIRIDHFIGFQNYYSIPAGAKDATKGEWQPGPKIDFFNAVRKAIPDAKLIAEDLGIVTEDVANLRDTCGLPGMAVLQFAFGDGPGNPYLPHNHKQNLVVYPGTHDNDTTLGWYATAADHECDYLRRYLETDGTAPNWDLYRAAMRSPARLAVAPLQDLMNLGNEGRLNAPGNPMGNWQWRFTEAQLDTLWSESRDYLLQLNTVYGRHG